MKGQLGLAPLCVVVLQAGLNLTLYYREGVSAFIHSSLSVEEEGKDLVR